MLCRVDLIRCRAIINVCQSQANLQNLIPYNISFLANSWARKLTVQSLVLSHAVPTFLHHTLKIQVKVALYNFWFWLQVHLPLNAADGEKKSVDLFWGIFTTFVIVCLMILFAAFLITPGDTFTGWFFFCFFFCSKHIYFFFTPKASPLFVSDNRIYLGRLNSTWFIVPTIFEEIWKASF